MYQKRPSITQPKDRILILLYVAIALIGLLCIFSVEYRGNEDVVKSFFAFKKNYSKQFIYLLNLLTELKNIFGVQELISTSFADSRGKFNRIFDTDWLEEDFDDFTLFEYKDYYQSLILPYDTIDDFMSSTVQQIDFPAWSMTTAEQTRPLGKQQDYKSSKPLKELFNREITLTMKISDAYLNYFIFLENSLEFLDFSNKSLIISLIDPFICLLKLSLDF